MTSKPHRTDIISFGPKFSVAKLIFKVCVLIEYHQRTFPFQVAHEICHTDFRGCPACFLILKGVVISSHETNRFS